MRLQRVTGPVIEASYRRFLAAFEAHLTPQPFLLGQRPGACDFAVYGQLTQLAEFDPTPMALTLEIAPRRHRLGRADGGPVGPGAGDGDWITIGAAARRRWRRCWRRSAGSIRR